MSGVEAAAAEVKIPLHRWTHDGGKVLLVKCLDAQGLGHGGFPWPKSGKVVCPRAAAGREAAAAVTGDDDTDCASGGLFGWAWELNLGGGKSPNFRAPWVVFAAGPADVVDLGDKQKVVGEAEVVYHGEAFGALLCTLKGREAWIAHRTMGCTCSATGNRSASSATGNRSASSATGYSSASSATGYSSASSATGDRSASSATGDSSASSATGDSSVGCLTGENGTLEIGPHSLGAVTASRWIWRVHAGAVVACRWRVVDGAWYHRLLVADEMGLKEGEVVQVDCGNVRPGR